MLFRVYPQTIICKFGLAEVGKRTPEQVKECFRQIVQAMHGFHQEGARTSTFRTERAHVLEDIAVKKRWNHKSEVLTQQMPPKHPSFPSLSASATAARWWPVRAFSLIELLVVVGIIILLGAVATPVMQNMTSQSGAGGAAAIIDQAFERARMRAVSRQTHVYVAIGQFQAYSNPGVSGTGEIAVCLVESSDGSALASVTSDNARLVSTLVRAKGAAIATLGADVIQGRPTSDVIDYVGRAFVGPKVGYPLQGTMRYEFNQLPAIEFSPDGTARIAGDTSLPGYIEVGLRPARGETMLTDSSNVAAVQLSGITGKSTIHQP